MCQHFVRLISADCASISNTLSRKNILLLSTFIWQKNVNTGGQKKAKNLSKQFVNVSSCGVYFETKCSKRLMTLFSYAFFILQTWTQSQLYYFHSLSEKTSLNKILQVQFIARPITYILTKKEEDRKGGLQSSKIMISHFFWQKVNLQHKSMVLTKLKQQGSSISIWKWQ